MNKKELLADGSTYELSLSKLTGKKVVDIKGYVSTQFGFPVFKTNSIVFEDGTEAELQGEHDIAFIPQGRDYEMPPNMDEESLSKLED